jgi:hypothetical protein
MKEPKPNQKGTQKLLSNENKTITKGERKIELLEIITFIFKGICQNPWTYKK